MQADGSNSGRSRLAAMRQPMDVTPGLHHRKAEGLYRANPVRKTRLELAGDSYDSPSPGPGEGWDGGRMLAICGVYIYAFHPNPPPYRGGEWARSAYLYRCNCVT